jgi:hypothetical protein
MPMLQVFWQQAVSARRGGALWSAVSGREVDDSEHLQPVYLGSVWMTSARGRPDARKVLAVGR